MNKYIRTENRIIDVTNWHKDEKGYYIYAINNLTLNNSSGAKIYIDRRDIKKEADTIKELCDNFVEVYKALKNEVYEQPYFDIVSEQVWNGAPVGNLYGAIWTSKGLIYVAKMNNKGNLELI